MNMESLSKCSLCRRSVLPDASHDEEVIRCREQVLKLKEENASVNKKYLDLVSNLTERLNDLEYFQIKAKSLEESSKGLEGRIQDLEKLNNTLLEKNRSLEGNNRDLEEKAKILLEQNENLVERNRKLNESVKSLEEEKKELEGSKKKLEENRKSLLKMNKLMAKSRKRLGRVHKKLIKTSESLTARNAELEGKNKTLEGRVVELEARSKPLEKRKFQSEVNVRKEESIKKCSKLEKGNLTWSLQEQIDDIGEVMKELKVREVTGTGKDFHIVQLQIELQALEFKNESLVEENEQLIAAFFDLHEESKREQQQRHHHLLLINGLKKKKSKLAECNKSLLGENCKLEKKVCGFEAVFDKFRRQCDVREENALELFSFIADFISNRFSTLENFCDKMETSSGIEKDNRETVEKQLQNENRKLLQSNKSLLEKTVKLEKEVAAFKKEKRGMEAVFEKFRSSWGVGERKWKSVSDLHTSIVNFILSRRAQFDQFCDNKEVVKFPEDLEDMKKNIQDLKEANEALEKRNTVLQALNIGFEQKTEILEKLTEAQAGTMKEFSKLQVEKSSLETQLKEKILSESRHEKLKESWEGLKRKLEESNKLLRDESIQLERKLEILEDELLGIAQVADKFRLKCDPGEKVGRSTLELFSFIANFISSRFPTLDEFIDKVGEIESNPISLQTKNKLLIAVKGQLEKKIHSLSEDKVDLAKSLDVISVEMAQLQATVAGLTDENRQLKDKADVIAIELLHRELEIDDLSGDNQRFEEIFEDFRTKCDPGEGYGETALELFGFIANYIASRFSCLEEFCYKLEGICIPSLENLCERPTPQQNGNKSASIDKRSPINTENDLGLRANLVVETARRIIRKYKKLRSDAVRKRHKIQNRNPLIQRKRPRGSKAVLIDPKPEDQEGCRPQIPSIKTGETPTDTGSVELQSKNRSRTVSADSIGGDACKLPAQDTPDVGIAQGVKCPASQFVRISYVESEDDEDVDVDV